MGSKSQMYLLKSKGALPFSFWKNHFRPFAFFKFSFATIRLNSPFHTTFIMNKLNFKKLNRMIMKRFRFYSLAMLVVAGIILGGCKKDEVEKIDLGPTLSLKSGEGYTSADFSVEDGTSLKFGVTASKSATHDNFLTRFNILYNSLTLVDTVLNTANFDADFTLKFVGAGTGKIIFKITAQQGLTAEKELNVTITEPVIPGVEVFKRSDIELGSFNDPIGSFFNTTDTTVYTVAQAKENQAKVDFLFFKGVTNQNTIAAPDDADANSITDFQLGDWTTKNPTRFILTNLTPAQFDEIGDLHEFPEFEAANALSKINQLEANNVLFFKTAAGKLGYIKIADLYFRGDRIKIDVIVEK